MEEEIKNNFKSATTFVRGNAGRFESTDLLYLYARFKQVTEGQCNTPKPGFFDFQGKAKWEAWKSLGCAERENCMIEYVAKVSDLHPEWHTQLEGGDHAPAKTRETMGVAVSSMSPVDDVIPDTDKSIFDWLKEDNQSQVVTFLKTNDVNTKDEDGLMPLHWACDRGLLDMTECLLNHGANINSVDDDEQSALHYAVSCEHEEVVRLLVRRGADTSIRDSDGNTPAQLTDNQTILSILQT